MQTFSVIFTHFYEAENLNTDFFLSGPKILLEYEFFFRDVDMFTLKDKTVIKQTMRK